MDESFPRQKGYPTSRATLGEPILICIHFTSPLVVGSPWGKGRPFARQGGPSGGETTFSHVNTLTHLPETTPWKRFDSRQGANKGHPASINFSSYKHSVKINSGLWVGWQDNLYRIIAVGAHIVSQDCQLGVARTALRSTVAPSPRQARLGVHARWRQIWSVVVSVYLKYSLTIYT